MFQHLALAGEQFMMRRGRTWLLLFASLLLVVVGIDGMGTFYWSGTTDLEITFVVTDAATGKPVAGAQVEADYPEGGGEPFTLTTDELGRANRMFANSTSGGKQSYFGFVDTWSVNLPPIRFRIAPAGASPGEWQYFEWSIHQPLVRRIAPRQSKLVLPILWENTR